MFVNVEMYLTVVVYCFQALNELLADLSPEDANTLRAFINGNDEWRKLVRRYACKIN